MYMYVYIVTLIKLEDCSLVSFLTNLHDPEEQTNALNIRSGGSFASNSHNVSRNEALRVSSRHEPWPVLQATAM